MVALAVACIDGGGTHRQLKLKFYAVNLCSDPRFLHFCWLNLLWAQCSYLFLAYTLHAMRYCLLLVCVQTMQTYLHRQLCDQSCLKNGALRTLCTRRDIIHSLYKAWLELHSNSARWHSNLYAKCLPVRALCTRANQPIVSNDM